VPKKGLHKGADGIVHPLLNLPAEYHHVWNLVVAAMASWAVDMEQAGPLKVSLTHPVAPVPCRLTPALCRPCLRFLLVLTCADVCWHVLTCAGMCRSRAACCSEAPPLGC
jgi:hypothetical protein